MCSISFQDSYSGKLTGTHDLDQYMCAKGRTGVQKCLFFDVFCLDKIILQSGSECITRGKIQCDNINGETMLFEPDSKVLGREDILIASSLCCPSENLIPIRIINLGEEEVIIGKDTKIGQLNYIMENSRSDESRINALKITEMKGTAPLLKEVTTLKHLTSEQKNRLIDLIQRNSSCFSESPDDLGECTRVEHCIEVDQNTPQQQTYYKIPMGLEEEVNAEIERWHKSGIIRESNSSWNSPLVVVRKPSGKIRLCVDYRKLNAVTIKPTFHIPDSAELFDCLGGATWFSSIDLSNAYHQCPLRESDKYLTAFTTKKGRFEFNRMPFGLSGAPFTFQKLMNLVLKEENWDYCLIYLDDILVFSENFEEHMVRLEKVLTKIGTAGLKLSAEKCKFCMRELKFLGHVISKDGVNTDPGKIEALKKCKIPSCVNEMQSFLGFLNYYRRFIKNYANMVRPLENLIAKKSKNNSIEWTEEATKSFREAIETMCSAPVLAFPQKEGTFILDCDACYNSIGAVLSQLQEGQEKIISYGSKKMSKCEQSYCITRKELLAVYYFVKYFKQYLLGRKFIIRTDHRALTWMMNWQRPNSSQYCTWIAELENYDFQIEFRKGKDHTNADYISRSLQCEQCDLNHEDPKKRRNTKVDKFMRTNMMNSPDNKKENEGRERIRQSITTQEKEVVLHHYHEGLGHIGITKMIDLMKRHYEWKGMEKDIQSYVLRCKPCQERKSFGYRKKSQLFKITAEYPFQKVMFDLTGPIIPSRHGHRYIMAMVDVFTRFPILIPLRNIEAQCILDVFKKRWIPLFGKPEVLISDGAHNLNSSMVYTVLNKLGIEKKITSAYRPESNGIVEREFRTLKDRLYATMKSEGKDWTECLPNIEMGLRATKHRHTKLSPYEAIYGFIPRIDEIHLNGYETLDNINVKRIENFRNLKSRNQVTQKQVNYKPLFSINDLVMIKNWKYQNFGIHLPKYIGPAKIIKVVDKKSYIVEMNGNKYRRHETSLKAYRAEREDLEKRNENKKVMEEREYSKRQRKSVDRFIFNQL